MKKVELKFENSLVNKYIDDIQSQFPEYRVTVDNVNDFSMILSERANCKNCCGLDLCANANRGHVMDYLEDHFVFTECERLKNYKQAHNKQSLIKTLYLPNKILEASLDSFDLNSESRKKIYKHTLKLIEEFKSNNKKDGQYLHGSFSIGKTYTLGCIANEFAKNGISCLLIYFPDLVVDLKNAISSSRFESLLNMLKSIDVLMLDDFGSENMTPWLRDEILGPIINYRLLENKLTFISSNIGPDSLKGHIAIDKAPSSILKADRLLSRLTALMLDINMDDSGKYAR